MIKLCAQWRLGIGYTELFAAALLEFNIRSARARIISAWLFCCTMRQLLPSPVIVNRHSAASKECRCFGGNAVFVLRLQAEQRLAVLVAAQCENREDETCAVLRSEQPL